MNEPKPQRGDSPQQPAAVPEVVRLGRDDPAPGPREGEAEPTPPPRRDNQGEAITGAPTV